MFSNKIKLIYICVIIAVPCLVQCLVSERIPVSRVLAVSASVSMLPRITLRATSFELKLRRKFDEIKLTIKPKR